MEQSDIRKYEQSLFELAEHMNRTVRSSKTDIVIALSRKGPRLLEFLTKKYQLKPMTIVTEHALPFIFERISKDVENHYRLFIVDDAIYFGSSILGLKEEIDAYISSYQLDGRVEIVGIFSCIKDKDAIEFPNIQVYSDTDIHPGFGHFFVKNVMKDLQSLGKSLEVEFPAVSYTLSKDINFDVLKHLLSSAFGEDKVYSIDASEGIKSISIVLSEVRESSFRKFRIFLEGKTVTVVAIAPELVTTNFSMFRYVHFGSNEHVNQIWKKTEEELQKVAVFLEEKSVNTRNLMRTAVVLLNYFSSLDTFCYYRDKLIETFKLCAGDLYKITMDAENLFYILGDNARTEQIVSAWSEAISDQSYCTRSNTELENHKTSNVVFELSKLADLEAGRLERTNLAQLLNCKTMEEALSSMFFNQTLMIERWSRGLNLNRQERLRFGYTFLYIWQYIWDNANSLTTNQLSQSVMHHWVDVQIDNGSIVPQYIIDNSNQQWTRVFRPGENEDLLISHLGRIVVHVMKQMSFAKEDSSIIVNKSNLQGVLSVVYDKLEKSLHDEEFNNCLSIDIKRHQLDYQSSNLVDILVRMLILTKNSDESISLHSRICNNEFSRNTTLSKELLSQIDVLIQNILKEAGVDEHNSQKVYGNTINYFLADKIRIEDVQKDLRTVGKQVSDSLTKLMSLQNDLTESRKLVAKDRNIYMDVLLCYEMNDHVLLESSKYNLSVELLPYLWRIRQMVHLVNILIVLYFGDKDVMKEYCGSVEKLHLVHQLQTAELLEYLNHSHDFHKNGAPKEELLKILRDYINDIILKF